MWWAARHRIPSGPVSVFWLAPALCVFAAVGLAFGLIFVNHKFNIDSPILFQGTPSGARTALNSIITAMISLTGLVFSVSFVALQLTSAQFSPRVLQLFLSDRIIQITFGVFVATFVYAMVVLQTLKGDSNNSDVPRAAVGPDGEVRLVIPRYHFCDLLAVTVGETWRYGSDAVQVPDRLERMLADLAEVARPEHQDAVRRWLRVVGA